MGKTKEEKHRAKRKVKQEKRRQKVADFLRKGKADYLFYEAIHYWKRGNLDKALLYLTRAVHLDPKNEDLLNKMERLGREMNLPEIEFKALLNLHDHGFIRPDQRYTLCHMLEESGRYEQALSLIQETLPLISRIYGQRKKKLQAALVQAERRCSAKLQSPQKETASPSSPPPKAERQRDDLVTADHQGTATVQENQVAKEPLPEIPVSIEVDARPLYEALAEGKFNSLEDYELTLHGHSVRLRETFEDLICLNSLKGVRSLWYQEETARKVLKIFRGRALLADEVGLGKTIEALMVLKEYMQRGMVKTALILTPTPLVSQWKEELKVKFALNFPSTDDSDYRSRGASFWKEPFILASINLAKSKNNFPLVSAREYDMVIVDEAHHLKNRNTLNWKLVNSLKKRFLVLLTATPVENDMMELYNLVTLLKPGQLKTASEFRNEFMTRGDPTDPKNRSQLKELLGQVMIRNTRALAKVDIPPRFAQTIKVKPHQIEIDLYDRISSLVRAINAHDGTGHRLLLRNLLEEAGSSPRAVSLTLSRILERHDSLREHEGEIQAISNMCRCLDETSKNKTLLKLSETSPGKKIVFVKYVGTLEHVCKFLARHRIPYSPFHGQMDNRTKDEQIQSFREHTDILVTTEIGGEGRNLQFCHQMINYDLPWNPMKIEQRIGRIHRIGQEKEVMIYNLCAAGSVEDYILDILDKKINMFEMVIGEIDMILGRLTGEQDFSETVFDIWINSASEEERERSFAQLGSELREAKTGYQKTKELDEKLFGENYEL